MKKITLFLGLSIVGLIGFAQQSNENQLNIQTFDQQKEYTIRIDKMENSSENINELLISEAIGNSLNIEINTHEFVHNISDPVDFKSKFIEGAYSYNEYAFNFDFKPNTIEIVKI
jgi:hypothetical protein